MLLSSSAAWLRLLLAALHINSPTASSPHTPVFMPGGWTSSSGHPGLVRSVCSYHRPFSVHRLILLPLFLSAHPEQARRELRRLKEEARRKHAVAVIWAYWQGLKVPSGPMGVAVVAKRSSTPLTPLDVLVFAFV